MPNKLSNKLSEKGAIMYYINNNEKGNMIKLIEFIVDNNIELKLGHPSDEYTYAFTDKTFNNVIKETLGTDYGFIVKNTEESLLIVNNTTHCILGEIVGRKDMAYSRGDHQTGVLTPLYFIADNWVYIKKNKVGRTTRENQLRYDAIDEIYVVCTNKNTLCRCDMDGTVIWESIIPCHYTQDLIFDYNDYPAKDFPNGLISISAGKESFGKYMFFKDSGKLYGKVNVVEKYSI